MTVALDSLPASPATLPAPPVKGWNCIVCRKDSNDFHLIINRGCKDRGCKDQCVLHRTCYPKSVVAFTGQCPECNAPLRQDYVRNFGVVRLNRRVAQDLTAKRPDDKEYGA